MIYNCSTPPTTYPVSVADLRDHARIDSHADDTYLSGLIVKATRTLERELSRQFITATWKLYFNQFPTEILLEKLPVASITSISYVDMNGTTQTLSASLYQVQKESPDAPARIMPAYGQVWPATRGDIYNAATVTFVAGYGAASAVPQAPKHAILMLTAHWYDNREAEAMDANLAAQSRGLTYAMDYLKANEDWGAYA